MFENLALWLKLVLSWLTALLLAFGLAPAVERLAFAVGAVDLPGEARRVHTHPVPRLGGLSIFLGFAAAALLFAQQNARVTGVLLGAVLIACMGAADDIVSLRPWTKLGLQILAALVAVRCGVVHGAAIGPLGAGLTVLWLVTCTNAVNLIDGLDGLAAGLSLVGALTLLLAASAGREPDAALLLAALSGACLGFLPANLHPARMFMGDVGSQLLGFVLAAVSAPELFRGWGSAPAFLPVLALAVPLTDTVFAFFRRILHGQSPFHADRGHLHHRLLDRGLDQRQAALLLVGIAAALGLGALLL